MTWTTPRTWVTGEVLSSANMNTHVRDNLAFLKSVGAGVDLDYVEAGAGVVNVTGTSAAAATSVVTGSTITLDGATPIMVSVLLGEIMSGSAGQWCTAHVELYDGATDLAGIYRGSDNSSGGIFGQGFPQQTPAGTVFMQKRLAGASIPTSGSHQYSARAWYTGGSGAYMQVASNTDRAPASFIRVQALQVP